jgi:hypothetical protein
MRYERGEGVKAKNNKLYGGVWPYSLLRTYAPSYKKRGKSLVVYKSMRTFAEICKADITK